MPCCRLAIEPEIHFYLTYIADVYIYHVMFILILIRAVCLRACFSINPHVNTFLVFSCIYIMHVLIVVF